MMDQAPTGRKAAVAGLLRSDAGVDRVANDRA